jgi:hypothetical protein
MKAVLKLLPALCIAAICLSGAGLLRAHPAADEMAAAAKEFLASLDDAQRAKAAFGFKDDERENWHYIPKDRRGLALKDMKPGQRKLAHALLRSGLSERGYAKATNVISLEAILADLEGAGRRFPRDPELYYVSVFGQPGPKATWGWRVEGHHLSANVTIVKGEYFAGTPSFLGSNPAEVRKGPRAGLRALAGEEDRGRQLIQALDADQRKQAIFDTTAPKEIFTEAKRRVKPLEPAGLAAAGMTPAQRDLLMALVREYVERLRPDLAALDLKKIEKAGVEKIHFAWAGGIEKGQGHYYRAQGPTFVLEYDNTQNDNNHIHAVWRDFESDFGDDLLKRHYEETPHGK